jgi:hypothetical protein
MSDNLPMRTPQQAREAFRDRELTFEVRYLHALNTVEAFMESHFHVRGDSFQVGFAAPPLGGGDGWLDEGMVSHICEAAEASGWLTAVDGNFITFTAPADTAALEAS